MTLNDLRIQRGKSWQQIARELSEITATHAEPPIYYHRLWCMRRGEGRPVSEGERRALDEWSDGEVECYKN